MSPKNFMGKIQDKLIIYSKSKYALAILIIVAFTESSFFIIPPDIFLFTMAMVIPQRALFYALITTIFSVLGGLFGYLLGYWFFDIFIYDYIASSDSYLSAFNKFKEFYNHYSALATFIAGFTPIPYKIATVTSGALHANIFSFTIASIASRGLRFFLLGFLVRFFYRSGKDIIIKHFKKIIYIVSIIIFVVIVAYILYTINY